MSRPYCLFPTAIGSCAIAWSNPGVTALWLPEETDHQTRARVARRFPPSIESSPPPFVQHAIEGIVALLTGEARDLSDVPLDLDEVPEFHCKVYDVARTIKPGTTLSYGEIAARRRRAGRGARGWSGARTQSHSDHRPVPSRARRGRRHRRLLRAGRHGDEAASARHRRRTVVVGAGFRRPRAG